MTKLFQIDPDAKVPRSPSGQLSFAVGPDSQLNLTNPHCNVIELRLSNEQDLDLFVFPLLADSSNTS